MPNCKLPPGKSDRLCECGCGELTPIARVSDRSKGWVRGEGVRFCRGHAGRALRKAREAAPDRWVVNGDGCWIWQGKPSRDGYGRARRSNGRWTNAHRMLYEARVAPVADGMVLHHVCEVRLCVNPEHLRVMSIGDHMSLHHKGRPKRVGSRHLATCRCQVCTAVQRAI